MDDITRFRREVKRQLRCTRKLKSDLMQELDGMLSLIKQDNDNANREELVRALGTPDELAVSLMSKETAEERRKYRNKMLFIRIMAGVFIILLIVYVILAAKVVSETPIKSVDTIIIYEEAPPSVSVCTTTEALQR